MQNEFYLNYKEQIKQSEAELLADVYRTLPAQTNGEKKLIEHVVSRIKSYESSVDKLKRAGYAPTEENAVNVLSDVIGIRLIAHFIGDIYTIRNIIANSGKFEIVKEKDYVMNPKPSGYRGYHIIVMTQYNNFPIKAEIQIRTVAMDCWASLEHQIRYKKGIKNTDIITSELKRCSNDLMSADIAMEQIWTMVQNQEQETENWDMFEIPNTREEA